MQNALAYYAMSENYSCKIFIKLTPIENPKTGFRKSQVGGREGAEGGGGRGGKLLTMNKLDLSGKNFGPCFQLEQGILKGEVSLYR